MTNGCGPCCRPKGDLSGVLIQFCEAVCRAGLTSQEWRHMVLFYVRGLDVDEIAELMRLHDEEHDERRVCEVLLRAMRRIQKWFDCSQRADYVQEWLDRLL